MVHRRIFFCSMPVMMQHLRERLKPPSPMRKATRGSASKNPILVRRNNQKCTSTTRNFQRDAKTKTNTQSWLNNSLDPDSVNTPLNTSTKIIPYENDWIIVQTKDVPDHCESKSQWFWSRHAVRHAICS